MNYKEIIGAIAIYKMFQKASDNSRKMSAFIRQVIQTTKSPEEIDRIVEERFSDFDLYFDDFDSHVQKSSNDSE